MGRTKRPVLRIFRRRNLRRQIRTLRAFGIRLSGALSFSSRNADGKLSGIFRDHYVVNGVVSGKSAFITLIDDDWVEYTVELKRKNRGELTGFYSPSVPFSRKGCYELVLKRVGD